MGTTATGRDTRRRDLLGAGLLVMASLAFGTVVAVGKVSTKTSLSVYWILAVRFAIAAVVLAGVLALLRRPLAAARGERLGLVALGVAGYGVEASLFFLSLEHGNASTVTLLFFTYPAMVALASMALGHGAPGLLLGGALVGAVAGAGLVVASSGGLAVDAAGIAFALLAALTFTGYLLGADRVLRRTDALTSALWVSGWAAVGLAAFSALTGRARVPDGFDEWWPIVAMGVATAVAFVCLLAGLRILGAVRTAIIASTEPVAGATLAAIFLNERITPLVATGGALILAGAVAASLTRRPSTKPPEAEVPFEPPAP